MSQRKLQWNHTRAILRSQLRILVMRSLLTLWDGIEWDPLACLLNSSSQVRILGYLGCGACWLFALQWKSEDVLGLRKRGKCAHCTWQCVPSTQQCALCTAENNLQRALKNNVALHEKYTLFKFTSNTLISPLLTDSCFKFKSSPALLLISWHTLIRGGMRGVEVETILKGGSSQKQIKSWAESENTGQRP